MNTKQMKAMAKEWIINLCCDADLPDKEIRENIKVSDLQKIYAELTAQA